MAWWAICKCNRIDKASVHFPNIKDFTLLKLMCRAAPANGKRLADFFISRRDDPLAPCIFGAQPVVMHLKTQECGARIGMLTVRIALTTLLQRSIAELSRDPPAEVSKALRSSPVLKLPGISLVFPPSCGRC